mmetsp:Transcript_19100/g.64523  ORF Transcript_19100/g.64523 Transcript_19100/m.64523 type:complete len:252 (-) Transcript_19100:287-1042(-)
MARPVRRQTRPRANRLSTFTMVNRERRRGATQRRLSGPSRPACPWDSRLAPRAPWARGIAGAASIVDVDRGGRGCFQGRRVGFAVRRGLRRLGVALPLLLFPIFLRRILVGVHALGRAALHLLHLVRRETLIEGHGHVDWPRTRRGRREHAAFQHRPLDAAEAGDVERRDRLRKLAVSDGVARVARFGPVLVDDKVTAVATCARAVVAARRQVRKEARAARRLRGRVVVGDAEDALRAREGLLVRGEHRRQ